MLQMSLSSDYFSAKYKKLGVKMLCYGSKDVKHCDVVITESRYQKYFQSKYHNMFVENEDTVVLILLAYYKC